MENFCKHVEGHLTALNMAEEDEEETGGQFLVLWIKVSTCGSTSAIFRAATCHV